MIAAENQPIADAELADLFAPLAGFDAIFIAVSGGADSTALMHLLHDWKSNTHAPQSVSVLTVDHGLRPGSDREAASVEAAAGLVGRLERLVVDAP